MQDTARITAKPRLFGRGDPSRRSQAFALFLCTFAARLCAQEALPEGLQWQSENGHWETAVALETDVSFRIDGLIAKVVVMQDYINDSTQWMEGRYLLPLPDEAAVGALHVIVGEREIVGEVREKQEAQAIYRAAAAQGQTAGLVEQARPNLFRTQVANIGPGERVKVRIEYWQNVRFADGAFSITLPLTLVPRYSASFVEATHAEEAPQAPHATQAAMSDRQALPPIVGLSVDLNPGLPIAQVESPTHRIDVNRQGERFKVQLADLAVLADRDFTLRWTPVPQIEPASAVFTEQVNGETYAYAMLMPPTQAIQTLPRELILVIDTSGSMHGTAIEQARAALVEALAHLRPTDRFNLIQFNSTASQLFDNAMPANEETLAQAARWISQLRADGGTEMSPALTMALQGEPAPGYVRQVVFATDAGVSNENALIAQIERELGQARLFPVGIGSAPNGWFLRRAAQVGRGAQLTIRNIGEVQAQMRALFAKLDRPALGNLSLNWPAGAEIHPQTLPDLYAGEPLLAVARLPQSSGMVRASGWNTQGDWNAALELSRSVRAEGVARLFAKYKVEALEDAMRQGAADEATIRPQIVELGITHAIVTRYTSLIAVEKQPSRPKGAALQSVQFANANPDEALAFAQGGTTSRLMLLIALALTLAAWLAAPGKRGGA